MKRVRLGAATLNQTPLDWDGNLQRILTAIHQARQQHAQILCFPELCITGYGCEDMFLAPHVWQTAWEMLQKIVPESQGLLLVVGLPLFVNNGVYNAACVLCDGQIVGFVAKQNLAGDGLHYEPRWFRAWPQGVTAQYSADGKSWPIGDLLFERDGLRIGFEICEDAWVADRPGNRMARLGVDVILNPSASHFSFGKHEIRRRFVVEGSRSFACSYVYANLVGNEAGRAIYDGGALIASCGTLIAEGPRFEFHEVQVVTADILPDVSRGHRAAIHAMPTSVSELSGQRLIPVPGHFTEIPVKSGYAVLQRAPDSTDAFSEFTRAIALGLFDYLRKTRSNGFVVSMSGGADSSACAVLIRCMVEQALAELGPEVLRTRLAWISSLHAAQTAEQFMRPLFAGIYQSTCNSTEVTRSAAAGVTQTLGGEFLEISVDELVRSYTQTIESAIGRQLSWQTDDIALQNIQARTRSPSVWLLTNIRGALLLSTSNRSEAAVGYATMDGDTSGGLAPIAGIDKAFLRLWLQQMETAGSAGRGPYPILKLVNAQQPTAELRPAEYAQTDESDLMPYPILEQIEELAIRDRLSPVRILELLGTRCPQWSATQLAEWVRRFFTLWSRNQWKRERFAPSFHVDDRNLDPRTWCRFPILSGGFRHELSQLVVESPDNGQTT